MVGLVEPTLRFAQYAILLGLFGWSAFRLIGLSGLAWLGNTRPPGLVLLAAATAPVVSAALMLMSIAAMMGVQAGALDWPMTEAMFLGTDMGSAFIFRFCLLCLGLVSLLGFGERRAGLMLAAACFAGALLTLGWSGHAAATEGGLGLFHRLNNGVHLIAAGLWLGAIGWFLALTIRCQIESDQLQAPSLLEAMHRFAPLGVTLVTLVALTGLINSHLIFGLPNLGATIGTPYGALLLIKIFLVGAMMTFGAHNARVSKASIRSEAQLERTHTKQAIAALRRSLASEFLLGLAVTGLVAVLGTKSPMTM